MRRRWQCKKLALRQTKGCSIMLMYGNATPAWTNSTRAEQNYKTGRVNFNTGSSEMLVLVVLEEITNYGTRDETPEYTIYVGEGCAGGAHARDSERGLADVGLSVGCVFWAIQVEDCHRDTKNYIPVSVQNQDNPAGSKEVIDIDVQTVKGDADPHATRVKKLETVDGEAMQTATTPLDSLREVGVFNSIRWMEQDCEYEMESYRQKDERGVVVRKHNGKLVASSHRQEKIIRRRRESHSTRRSETIGTLDDLTYSTRVKDAIEGRARSTRAASMKARARRRRTVMQDQLGQGKASNTAAQYLTMSQCGLPFGPVQEHIVYKLGNRASFRNYVYQWLESQSKNFGKGTKWKLSETLGIEIFSLYGRRRYTCTPGKEQGFIEGALLPQNPDTTKVVHSIKRLGHKSLTNVALEGLRDHKLLLAQVNTAEVNTAELNAGSTPSAQVNTTRMVNTSALNTGRQRDQRRRRKRSHDWGRRLQAEVQASRNQKIFKHTSRLLREAQ
ncbi:hypothetical protein Tco_1494330 [Tanacetum coccineum]